MKLKMATPSLKSEWVPPAELPDLTGAKTIAVACPFCSVMLNDAVTSRQQEGLAEGVVVSDVATLLLEATRKKTLS